MTKPKSAPLPAPVEVKTDPKTPEQKKASAPAESKPQTYEKPRTIDFKLLKNLKDRQVTFQLSKRVNRIGLSLLMGIFFHYMNFAQEVESLNLPTFWLILIAFYLMMERYEQVFYTDRIQVSNCVLSLIRLRSLRSVIKANLGYCECRQ